jgi:hypothetical protein
LVELYQQEHVKVLAKEELDVAILDQWKHATQNMEVLRVD